jgi:hypothetical protein
VRKKENRSGVGIQHNTTIIVIITRCDSWLLMKWESAGELPIRPQSSFMHLFLSSLFVSYLAGKKNNNDGIWTGQTVSYLEN